MPILQKVAEEFDDRNAVLFLALGLLSAGQKLGRLLALDSPSRGAREPGDEQLVFATLGLIALRKQLARALEDAALSDKPIRAAHSDSSDGQVSDLDLRGVLR